MSTYKIQPTILVEERRVQLREQVDNNAVGIQEVAKRISQILGKDHAQLTEIRFNFSGIPAKAGGSLHTEAGGPERTGFTCCASYADGTCGCVSDPPGIS